MIRESLQSVFEHWLIEKELALKIIKSNKAFNASLPSVHELDQRRSYQLSNLESSKQICYKLPELLFEKCSLPHSEYHIGGSIGKGNPAEIPWVCIFDKSISTKATEGYYVVYLFDADMKGVYLSLNLAWTQYSEAFGKLGSDKIKEHVALAKKKLRSDQGFSYDSISLNSTRPLGRGYENGSICSRYYAVDAIPSDEELINDVRNLIGVYRELKTLVGRDILDIELNVEEEEFQSKIQLNSDQDFDIPEGPIGKKDKKVSLLKVFPRNPKMASKALKNANYLCEYDPGHETFLSNSGDHQYVEAHHLIPMEFYGEFENNIDVFENIVSLCPNCHRAIHYGTYQVRSILVSKLYAMKREGLESREIAVKESELLQYYLS